MWSIFRKEVNGFFSSLIGYISMIVFFLVLGLNLWVFPGNIFDSLYATLESFFATAPWILMFLIPAITMRTLSDEFKSGTFELLATKPISDYSIVLGKFFACLFLWLVTWLPTLLYFVCIKSLNMPGAVMDGGATWGSYIGLFLLGAIFISIGIFASSVTNNQITSFLLGVVLCYLVYDAFFQISNLPVFSGRMDYFIQSLGIGSHYEAISRGVVDTRDLLYFFTVIAFFTIATNTVLEGRKW
ncbi:MAG: ABC transporter permease subunit [Chitinophagales bacterium]|nr:ABC transporter permease subunit [Chitinophagales bacterium]